MSAAAFATSARIVRFIVGKQDGTDEAGVRDQMRFRSVMLGLVVSASVAGAPAATAGVSTAAGSERAGVSAVPVATEISVPGWLNPGQPVAAPDGDLWLTAQRSLASGVFETALLKITSSGSVVGVVDRDAKPLLIGADGDLWFATYGTPTRFGTVTPGGRVRLIATLPGSGLKGATVGPQGNVWFALGDLIGYVTPAGQVSTVKALSDHGYTDGITTDTNGYVWAASNEQFGWISPNGQTGRVTEDSQGPLFSDLQGDVWADFGVGDHLAEVTSSPTPATKSGATWGSTLNGPGYSSNVALGTAADGHVWFLGDTDCGNSELTVNGCLGADPEIGALSTGGVGSVYPSPISPPAGLDPVMTAGPDGQLLMSSPTDRVSEGGVLVPENDGKLWAITLPNQSPPHAPTVQIVHSTSRARSTLLALRCSGEPGVYCDGTITLSARGSQKHIQTYAIDPGHVTTYTIATTQHRRGAPIREQVTNSTGTGRIQSLSTTTHVVN